MVVEEETKQLSQGVQIRVQTPRFMTATSADSLSTGTVSEIQESAVLTNEFTLAKLTI